MKYKRTSIKYEDLSNESKRAVSQQLNQSKLNKNHEDLVGNMLSAFHNLGCKMSTKRALSVQPFKQISKQSWSCQ